MSLEELNNNELQWLQFRNAIKDTRLPIIILVNILQVRQQNTVYKLDCKLKQ